jgi:predicted O-methyltransferase YrrM
MAQELWSAVDRYFDGQLLRADPVLKAALAASTAAGLPAIQVSPSQGKLLQLLALACGARRILEVGTLGGYSGICLARALPPEGKLVTLELDAHHAAVARASFERAGLAGRIELVVGPALASRARPLRTRHTAAHRQRRPARGRAEAGAGCRGGRDSSHDGVDRPATAA